MLTNFLDVPVQCPHVMAFPVPRVWLEEYRDAIRSILESADLTNMKRLWRGVEARLQSPVKWRVASREVHRVCDLADRALDRVATLRERIGDVERVRSTMTSVAAVDLSPDAWFAVSHAAAMEQETDDHLDEKVDELFATSFIDVLCSLTEQTLPDERIGPQHTLEWVRALTFRARENGGSQWIEDPINDVVLGYEPLQGLSPLTVLDHVRAQSALYTVLEAMVGAFQRSQGPGPFWNPALELQIEDPAWNKLPLFQADHWNWPFCQVRFGLGKDLHRIAARFAGAEPNRGWWDADSRLRFEEEHGTNAWGEFVELYWPACRERFAALLERAAAQDMAIVFTDDDFSHQIAHDTPGSRVVVES